MNKQEINQAVAVRMGYPVDALGPLIPAGKLHAFDNGAVAIPFNPMEEEASAWLALSWLCSQLGPMTACRRVSACCFQAKNINHAVCMAVTTLEVEA